MRKRRKNNSSITRFEVSIEIALQDQMSSMFLSRHLRWTSVVLLSRPRRSSTRTNSEIDIVRRSQDQKSRRRTVLDSRGLTPFRCFCTLEKYGKKLTSTTTIYALKWKCRVVENAFGCRNRLHQALPSCKVVRKGSFSFSRLMAFLQTNLSLLPSLLLP